MAYVSTINLVTNDTLPDLQVTIRDANTAAAGYTLDSNNSDTWAPIDLTNASARLVIREIGGTAATSITGVISDATNGVVIFPFTYAPFTSAGYYEGEVEVTYSSAGIQTSYDLIRFKVRGDFD